MYAPIEYQQYISTVPGTIVGEANTIPVITEFTDWKSSVHACLVIQSCPTICDSTDYNRQAPLSMGLSPKSILWHASPERGSWNQDLLKKLCMLYPIVCVCVCVCVQLCPTLQPPRARQAPLSMEFSRQEY